MEINNSQSKALGFEKTASAFGRLNNLERETSIVYGDTSELKVEPSLSSKAPTLV